ncbi:MAG TPA: SAF domain-containing protein [Planctomycetaceae bacterium]|nr:SAF domain-containing protein [Planctomycetaceae bacterium]
MQPYRRNRPASPWRGVLITLAAIVFGVAGTVGALVASGQLDLPFLTKDEGLRIALPANARPIEAYSPVRREDFIHPETGQLHALRLRPEQVVGLGLMGTGPGSEEISGRVERVLDDGGRPVFVLGDGAQVPLDRARTLGGAFLHVTDIIGRVVGKDKAPNYGFKEDGLLPPGTRPGIAGGTPPGMRALTLEADLLSGAAELQAGDRVDLIANVPVAQLVALEQSASRLPGAALVASSSRGRQSDQTEARAVALDALVVVPVKTRQKPTTTSSLTQGRRVQTVPVQEIVIAVHADDVPAVNEALGLGVKISCVAHSGRVDDSEATPGIVRVPVAGRPVVVYSELAPGDLIDPRTGRSRTIALPESLAQAGGIIRDPAEVVGRVVARDLAAGEYVTADDLLPPGTVPGLTGGVPPGMRMVTLDGSRLAGAASLQLRERFDIIATLPLSLADLTTSRRGGSRLLSAPVSLAAGQRQADQRVIVRDGVVVAPLDSPAIPAEPGASRRSDEASGPRIAIAVAPEQVPLLTEAFALGVQLTVVARGASGADWTAADLPPDRSLLGGMQSMEVMIGSKRETWLFLPGGGGGGGASPESPANGALPESAVRVTGN